MVSGGRHTETQGECFERQNPVIKRENKIRRKKRSEKERSMSRRRERIPPQLLLLLFWFQFRHQVQPDT